MASKFTLGDRCTVKSSKRIFAREYVEQGVPFWRSKDVIDKALGVFINYDLYISVDRFEEINSRFGSPQKGDLLMSSVGNRAGQPYVIEEEESFYFKDGNILWLSEFYGINPRFLAYWLKSEFGQKKLSSVMIGSAQKALTIDAIRNLDVDFPSETYQNSAVNILSSFDNKIAINKQTNQTLEQMSQTLFKSWFVDFDPVFDNLLAKVDFKLENFASDFPESLRKRAEIRLLALDEKAKAALKTGIQSAYAQEGATGQPQVNFHKHFPSEFEHNEQLGWIPKGWRVTQIKNISQVVKGKSYTSEELSESTTALVTLKSFKRGGGYRLDGLKEYTGKYNTEQEVSAGDLIVAYTDVTQAADVIGKPAMVISDSRYKHLVVSLDVAVVRPFEQIHKHFLYGVMQTNKFQNHTRSYATGTTVLHLNKEAVPGYWVAIPNMEILSTYSEASSPIYQKVDSSIDEDRALTKLRDTLLPKLISGELQIPDVRIAEVETA